MTGTEPTPTPGASMGAGLLNRVKNILLTPKAEWERIAGEPASIQSLYVGYACILAAIGPVATLIGGVAFSGQPIVGALIGAVISYLLSLGSVAVLAFVIEMLAPQFGGVKDRTQAFKVAIYGFTAMWLAGIFAILGSSPLIYLSLLGLYSVYLIYAGLGPVMRAPAEKSLAYTAVVVVVGIVLAVIISMIGGAILARFPTAPQAAPGYPYPAQPGTYPAQPPAGQYAPPPQQYAPPAQSGSGYQYPPQQPPQGGYPAQPPQSGSGYQYQPPQGQPGGQYAPPPQQPYRQ